MVVTNWQKPHVVCSSMLSKCTFILQVSSNRGSSLKLWSGFSWFVISTVFHLQTSHSDWVQFYYRNLKVVRRLEHVSLVLSRQGEHIPGSVSVSVCEPLCIFTYTHPQLCQNIKSACVWEVGQWLTSAFPFPAESSCSGGVIVAPGCLVRDRGSHALVVNL